MSDEIKQLRAELATERARRQALEAVLSTNEHLVLKAPALALFASQQPASWRGPRLESWEVSIRLVRQVPGTGERTHEEHRQWLDLVPVRSPRARLLFCALPEGGA